MYLSKLDFKNKSKIKIFKINKNWQNIQLKNLHLQKMYFRKEKMKCLSCKKE